MLKRNRTVILILWCFCDLLTYIPCYPKPGETVRGDKFLFDFGGKGANMCIIAAKLGGQNAMIAMVGDDAFGRETIRNFKKFQRLTKDLQIQMMIM